MDKLEDFLEKFRPIQDCSKVDVLLSTVTPLICVVFSIFVFGWEFVGEPIACWFPAYYTGNNCGGK